MSLMCLYAIQASRWCASYVYSQAHNIEITYIISTIYDLRKTERDVSCLVDLYLYTVQECSHWIIYI